MRVTEGQPEPYFRLDVESGVWTVRQKWTGKSERNSQWGNSSVSTLVVEVRPWALSLDPFTDGIESTKTSDV